MRKRKRNWENCLRANGYKITFPRRTILSAIEKHRGHPNAREVFRDLNADNPEIGLTTVYRTMELFVRLGILKKYDFGDGYSRYEIASDKHDHHHHIICRKCLNVIEYRDFLDEETTLIRKIQENLEKKYKFKINDHALDFYGYCGECSKSERKAETP